MKEIKFRAWDKWDKQMMYRGVFDRNWYGTETNDKDGCHTIRGIIPEDKSRVELMQNTGLKDKNGKEIYKSDILNLTPDGYIKELATVEWDYANASWIYIRISSLEIVNGERVYVTWKPVEIIGNIYENPELLQEAK
jgi:uncharacterized phage protein (TIGR01671 family)